MSTFSFQNECFLDGLVLRLATSFPSAMLYPFKISMKQYEERHTHNHHRDVVNQIRDLLSAKNPLAEHFLKGIKCLCMPDTLLLSHLEYLKKLLQHQDLSRLSFQSALEDVLSAIYKNDARGPIFAQIDQFDNKLRDLALINSKY